MQLAIAAALYSAFLWWFSTGIIFYLNARPAHTFRLSMIAATLIVAAALYGLWVSASIESLAGTYLAFTCGLVIWGWQTMSYFMGIITGPRRKPCPAGCSGLTRFFLAIGTSLYHELLIILTAGILVWMTWDQPNLFGLWTYLLLWGMHVSAKLNVFLGIRNLNVEFIPQRLAYLSTYFRQAPMNLLFPFSVTVGTIITILLIQHAISLDSNPFGFVGFILLATMMALAVIEHWFMILPIRADALWRWSLNDDSSVERTTGQTPI